MVSFETWIMVTILGKFFTNISVTNHYNLVSSKSAVMLCGWLAINGTYELNLWQADLCDLLLTHALLQYSMDNVSYKMLYKSSGFNRSLEFVQQTFCRLVALPGIQPTVSKHWRQLYMHTCWWNHACRLYLIQLGNIGSQILAASIKQPMLATQ